MQRKELEKLIKLVRDGIGSSPSFRMEEERPDHPYEARNKECLGAFLIGDKHANAKYWFLFIINWYKEDDYLVLCGEERKGSLAEIHEIDNDEAGNDCLKWEYIPVKRKDKDKNPARKKLFEQLAGDTKQIISIPRQRQELDDFLRACFQLARNREKAHNLEIADNSDESSPG